MVSDLSGTKYVESGISDAERDVAVSVLSGAMKAVTAREVIESLHGSRSGAASIEWIVASTEAGPAGGNRPRLDDRELVPLIVDMTGEDLLSHRAVRESLAGTLEPDELDELFNLCNAAYGAKGRAAKVKAVVDKRWHPGKSWAISFAKAVSLPTVFAGSRTERALAPLLEVQPFTPLQPLAPFQQELYLGVLGVLGLPKGDNRAILTLPTGAGKTRTTVEALVRWLIAGRFSRSILWVAQSEELCEQAVQSFRDVWFDLGHRGEPMRRSLNIGRHWGGRDVALGECDVVVASVQKLDSAFRSEDKDTTDEEVQELIDRVGVIVVDEAHRALAPSYTTLLRRFNMLRKGRGADTALLGLTATPRRTNSSETDRLMERFANRLLRPSSITGDPVEALRSQGVLAEVRTEVLDYGAQALDMADDPELANHFQELGEIPPKLLLRLAQDRARNVGLLRRVLEIDPSWPVLVFACSVQHAHAMTALLARRGRSAACITGDTRDATRRAIVDRFRNGQVSVLCNYGVLTTGFDAPQVRAVVVARPTESSILYEQMVGRGMRGPAFGGTKDCLIIDVADNLRWHNKAKGIMFSALDAEMRSSE